MEGAEEGERKSERKKQERAVQQEAASVRRKGGQTADNVLLHWAGDCECMKVTGSPLTREMTNHALDGWNDRLILIKASLIIN